MRRSACAVSLVLALTSSALAAEPGRPNDERLLVLAADKDTTDVQNLRTRAPDHWYVRCYGGRCSLSHNLLGEEGAGSPGSASFEITLGLHFERSTGKLTALAARAPADADRDRGIEIGFLDIPEPQKSAVVITVPLAPCDDTSCMGSVESDPSRVGGDLQVNFIDNILKYQMLTASYHAKGQRKTAVEDGGHFRAGYQILLAEMKKPQ